MIKFVKIKTIEQAMRYLAKRIFNSGEITNYEGCLRPKDFVSKEEITKLSHSQFAAK